MITNQQQYLVASARADEFRQALAAPLPDGLHPKAAKAMRDGLQSQLDDLDAELAEYDRLQASHPQILEAESIAGIGAALVKARIARNWTQKDLAARLSVSERQILNLETTLYRGVAVEQLQKVADTLKLRVRETITFEPE